MIYLSAQPDAYYFTWQIELQVFNFKNLGIAPEHIHVLLGYHSEIGLERHFTELMEKLADKASFFAYPDNRVNPKYASSIRPHIIQQHLKAFPYLQDECIFYHDSDIIFRELPNFPEMLASEKWYVSDTRNYLDTNYIKSFGEKELLSKLCDIVGVSPNKIIAQDANCGGAQYLLKSTSLAFWEKLEHDCEALYRYMLAFNHQQIDFLV